MTEKEALEKLEFFKDSIISLKGRISELENEAKEREERFRGEREGFERKLDIYIAEKNKEQEKNKELKENIRLLEKVITDLKDDSNKQVDYKREKEKEIKKLKEDNELLLKQRQELKDEVMKLRDEVDKCDNALDGLRVKAYHTIKHLVEEVIEPDKVRLAEKEKKIANLEMTLMMRSSSENVMIVKSAERELKEMIDQS